MEEDTPMFVPPVATVGRSESGRSSHGLKRRSRAWDYFIMLPETVKGEEKALCKYCNVVFTAKGNAGTSHLLRHISKCPKACTPEVEEFTRESLQCSTTRHYNFEPEVPALAVGEIVENDIGTESGLKRSKSRAWEHFEKLPATENGEVKARCNSCKDVFTAKGTAGTSHLLRHIPRCPKRTQGGIEKYFITPKRGTEGRLTSTNPKSNKKLVPVIAADVISEDDKTTDGCKRSKSRAWEVFEKLPNTESGSEMARCKYCKDLFMAKARTGTSHLLRHISRCPKNCRNGTDQIMQSSERKAAGSPTTGNTIFDEEALRLDIAKMIVVNELPLSIVEESSFRILVSKICPQVTEMSRKTIKQDVLSLFEKEAQNVRQLLATCTGQICLTLDTWKSITDDQYMCVTAYFIDSKWSLQRRILRLMRIAPPHDSISLDDEISSCLVHWNIERKLFSVTLGNVSTNDFAGFIDRAKHLHPCGGAFFHVRCCAHILNIIVQAAFELITDIIGKLRLAIKYVKQSPQRKKSFYDLARNLKLDARKQLFLDYPTKWDSLYLMLQVTLEYRDAFMYLVENDEDFKHSISIEEWEKVSSVCSFLKVFYEVTCMLSGTAYPTANLYFKGLWKIHCRLIDVGKSPQTFMTGMVKEMQKVFGEYWSEYNLILSCAAILDPRFKVRYVEYCFTKIYGDEGRQHVFTIVNTLKELYRDYVNISAAFNNATSAFDANFNGGYLDDEDADFATFKSEIIDIPAEKSHLDRYLEEANTDINAEVDVLEYWSSKERKYPDLSKMARDVLTVPISTVASESSFRTGRRLISPYKSALKAKTVQTLICLEDWLRAYGRTGLFESKMVEEDSSSGEDDGNC